MSDVVNLPRLRVGRCRIRYTLLDTFRAPASLGSLLRGGLGMGLRRCECREPVRKHCAGCSDRRECAYALLFEGAGVEAEATGGMEGVRPYVVEPPQLRGSALVPGDALVFHVILVGSATARVAEVLRAYRFLGEAGLGQRRARCALTHAAYLTPAGWELPLNGAAGLDGNLPAAPTLAEWAAGLPQACSGVTLRFVTPTSIKHERRVVAGPPSFSALIDAIRRRLTALAALYGDGVWDVDVQRLEDLAERVQIAGTRAGHAEWKHYSGRQDREFRIAGMVGEITYAGEIGALLPLIRAGELLHVGSKIVYGHGQYRVVAA